MNTRIVSTVSQFRMIHYMYIATRPFRKIGTPPLGHLYVYISAIIQLTIHCSDNPMEIWRTRVVVIRP